MTTTNTFQRNNSTMISFAATLFSRDGKLSWLVLLIGVVITIVISVGLEQEKKHNASTRFELLTNQLIDTIEDRLADHESVLLAGAGLFDASGAVTREQWKIFTERLEVDKHTPGIQGVGFSMAILPEQLLEHEALIRSEGFPNYTVRPAGERDLYTSIIFLEPFTERNLAAFGYDMLSEATRRDAMQRAVAKNTTQITGRVTLVQETHGEQQAGFLMYVPIYNQGFPIATEPQRWNALRGFVYSPYRMGDLMAGILQQKNPSIEFTIYDGENQLENALLFQSTRNSYNPQFTKTRQISAYGKVWTLSVYSKPEYYAKFNSPVDWLVTIFSLVITFLLAIILLQLKRRNAQATKLAHEMSADLKRSERFIGSVLEAASGVAIVATDLHGVITVFNKGAEKMLGYSRHHLIGKETPALWHLESEITERAKELSESTGKAIEGFQVFVENPSRDGLEQREWTYVHQNGELIRVSLTVTAIHDEQENVIGFLGVAEDIRERKRVEKMKNEFISTVSHELRTPLTSISGALDLIMTKRFGELSDKGTTLLANAHRNSKRLNHLINDLLDIEKIASGDMHFDMQPHSLFDIVAQSIESVQHYAQDRAVNITFLEPETDVVVSVDKQRFIQVMANLLSNAVKFSPEHSAVTVYFQITDSRVTVNVQDRGMGIAANFHAKIFQRFSQADGKDSRAKGGTGLGLAITRELLERMGGSISFESTAGAGSRFYFELPIAISSMANTKDDATNEQTTNRFRLLVLEDEPDVANLLAEMLENAGYDVDIALTGADALTKINTTVYDLITVDLMLPDTNGLKVIQQIRERPEMRDIPIVVVSAIAERGKLNIQGDTSHIDWLAKPIQQHHLLQTIAQRLAHLNRTIEVLHVEDDYDLHQVVAAMAGEEFNVGLAQTLQEAQAKIKLQNFDAIILDIGLPDGSGWELLPYIKTHQPNAYILVLSGKDVTKEELSQVSLAIRKSNLQPEKLIQAIKARLQK